MPAATFYPFFARSAMQSLLDPDPFADALESYFETGRGSYAYTRSDGLCEVEDAAVYFATFSDFPRIEKQALKFARGRVLDVGCGAGRHSLHLQRKGLRVTAIDASPRVAAIASARGVRDVRVASACAALPFPRGEFDTVLLFGNNLGICGSRRRTARMLRELARITRPEGVILGTTRAPGAFEPKHRAYWLGELARGGEFGVARYRLDYQGKHHKWVSLLLLAPSELMKLAWENGWRVAEVLGDGRADTGYAVVMQKVKRRHA